MIPLKKVMRDMKRTPRGQANKKPIEGGSIEEATTRAAALERLAFTIYQVGLARRRVQSIMESEDLSSVVWMIELNFVYTVLTDVDGLLRRLRRNVTDNSEG